MTTREAVISVLKEAGEPLHSNEITERVLKAGLWATKGKTPAATIGAMLASDVKAKGAASEFVQVAPSTFGLKEFEAKPDVAVTPSQPPKEDESGQPPQKAPTLTFTDAAEKVLEEFGEKKPMHYKDVTKRALEAGGLSTLGKTPEATLYSFRCGK